MNQGGTTVRIYKITVEVNDEDIVLAMDDVDVVMDQLREACYNTSTVKFLEYGRDD